MSLPATVLSQALPLARGAARLATDLGRVALGTDALLPHPRDRRFSDPVWTSNAVYRRLAQSHVALSGTLSRAVDSLAAAGLPWRDVERARFAASVATSALSPTNTLLGNPAALKLAFESGGASTLRGLGNAAHDLWHNGGLPSQTDRSAFVVGEDLAVTPGVVVHRDEVAEIISYSPSTPQVHARPLVIVPPPIGRFYFLDLRPGRSFVEHAVAQGLQVFMISWRNPGTEHADWGLDTYCARVLSAYDVVREITGADTVNSLGFCAGGILQTLAANHLAAQQDPTLHSASYGVTLLDFESPAALGAFSFGPLLRLAGAASKRSGILSAQSLATVFAFMRPDDLVFNYVVDGWLLGKPPPVFDILAWSVDGTGLPARLHAEFLDLFEHATMTQPGALQVLGTPVDLATVDVPTFVTGAVNDHLTPWTGCYRTTELLSGESTFVLSNAGHIASLVNPPGNPKASYLAGGAVGSGAQAWRDSAQPVQGSWWTAWAAWIAPLSGPLQDAVPAGSHPSHPALEAAPGAYVLDRAAAAA